MTDWPRVLIVALVVTLQICVLCYCCYLAGKADGIREGVRKERFRCRILSSVAMPKEER